MLPRFLAVALLVPLADGPPWTTTPDLFFEITKHRIDGFRIWCASDSSGKLAELVDDHTFFGDNSYAGFQVVRYVEYLALRLDGGGVLHSALGLRISFCCCCVESGLIVQL